MNENESVINLVLRQDLKSSNFNVSENYSVKFGRTKHILDFYIKNRKIGIITMNWKRTIPTNKLLQLEQIIKTLGLKKLVLICNSISGNAKEFLSRRDIPIQVVHLNEIIYKEKQIEDLIVSY